MKIITKLLKVIKKSKGLFTAKGKYLNYKEIHKAIYGFLKGFVIQNPKKLLKRLNVTVMDFEQWEDSEGQYLDLLMIMGYVSSKLVFSGILTVLTQVI